MPTLYIAMSPNYWGRGETIEAAKAALKEHGGTLARYVVYRMPAGAEEATVNSLGTMEWFWADGADTTASPEVVAKRGL